MEKKYSFLERLTSDTPAFFKKAQIFGIGLATLGGSLATVPGIPAKIPTILISVGTSIAAIAQFAVKQSESDNSPKQ